MSEEKIIEYLIKNKKKVLLNSEKNIEKHLRDISNLKIDILKNEKELNDLKEENNELTQTYRMLEKHILKNGLTFSIVNKSYNVKEWDNLHIKIKEDFLVIALKDGTEINIIESIKGKVLKKILSSHKYSVVITRIEGNLIKAKLYFNK